MSAPFKDPALVLFCLWLPVPEFQNHVYEAQLCNLGPSIKTKAALHCVLQKPAASEGSRGRRWLLVPTDATESECFFPGQWIRRGGRRDSVLISVS